MQFTPQQMAGYKGYSSGVLIGNWSEDVQVQEDKLRAFLTQSQASGVDPVSVLTARVGLAPVQRDGFVRFDAALQIRSLVNGGVDDLAIAIDTTPKRRPKLNHAVVTLSASPVPQARSTWFIRKTRDASNALYEQAGEGDLLHYGQLCKIVNEYGSHDGFHALVSEKMTATTQSRGGKQLVSAALGASSDMSWVVEPADATQGNDGEPIRVGAKIVIRHAMTRTPLLADTTSKMVSVGGAEIEVSAHMAKLQATKVTTPQTPPNFWSIQMAPAGTVFRPPATLPTAKPVLERVRSRILQRAGSSGFRAIVRSLNLMDDDGSKTLSRAEFKEGMATYGLALSTAEVDHVFAEFDRNGDGQITVSEFLRTLRGPMNTRRLLLTRQAFSCVDHDGSGIVTFDELRTSYARGLPNHPAVKAGIKTEQQVLQEFVADWDKNADGKITEAEFVEYYSDVSAGIDDDDYFELMMRNAWHMSGGTGWSANTANKRVLVVHTDDSQEVIELTNDLGIDVKDVAAIRRKLQAQGVTDIKRIELAH
jgi:Ca2+-binding EF-hand superfamily protein